MSPNYIEFYYIDGISRNELPNLRNQGEYDSFFNGGSKLGIVRKVKIDGFYPPFYKNQITVSTDEEDSYTHGTVNFNQPINYCCIYNSNVDMHYYYFISSFEYTSENIVKINISMDVFTTYRPYMKINSCIINRKFIKRYDSRGLINRKYIRENPSNGYFVLSDYKGFYKGSDFDDKVSDDTEYTLCIKTTDDIPYKNDYPWLPRVTNTYSLNGKCSYSMYTQRFIPYAGSINSLADDTKVKGTDGKLMATFNVYYGLLVASRRTECVNLYTVPFSGSKLCWINVNDDTIYVNNAKGNEDANADVSVTNDWGPIGTETAQVVAREMAGWLHNRTNNNNKPEFNVYYKKFTLPFKRLDSPALMEFKWYYEPALLDENFMRVEFGEKSAKSTFPLFQALEPIFYVQHFSDMNTGSRFYQLSFTTAKLEGPGYNYATPEFIDSDPYGTLSVASNILTIDIIKDSFNEWYSYNKMSLVGAFAKDGLNAFSAFASSNIRSSRLESQMSSILADKSNYDRRYKHAKVLKKKALSRYASLYGQEIDTESEGYIDTGTSVNNLLGVATDAVNAMYAPDKPVEVGSYFDNRLAHTCFVEYSLYEVNDIEVCAQYFHRNGNLVDELYNATEGEDLFDYLNNRKYYNVVKLSDVDITLNCLQSEELVDTIESTLSQGFRLWNVFDDMFESIGIGNFKYDNIERSV